MSLLDAATFVEEIAPGTVIYNVQHLLPRNPNKHYQTREMTSEVYVHHSGKQGRPGLQGLRNSARYVVRYRGWPGCPYHYWIPFEELRDNGKRVIFQSQPEHAHTYHAGRGPNSRSIAVCLQGNTTARPASNFQLRCLADILHWLDLPNVFGHCQAPPDGHPKATCPGSHAMAFLAGLHSA